MLIHGVYSREKGKKEGREEIDPNPCGCVCAPLIRKHLPTPGYYLPRQYFSASQTLL